MNFKIILLIIFYSIFSLALNPNFDANVTHGFADNNGIKIHYSSLGKGPLIVMVHGFPSFWYMWREQMQALEKDYQVVAIDQRGYNLSDKPKGAKNYDVSFLVEDVAAVIKHLKYEKAIIIGHDWGAVMGWQFALAKPEMLDRLIILSYPHPNGIKREMQSNTKQYSNRAYARNFRRKNSYKQLKATELANWVKDPEAKKKFIEAFNKSDFEAMLNYYKSYHLPKKPIDTKIKVPVLLIHGLNDKISLPTTLNNTWDWLEKDFTLVTIPTAGHHVTEDAPDLVTRSIKMWLGR